MKATIEFDLSCDEDKESYKLFNEKPNYKYAISEIDSWLRKQIKYNDFDDYKNNEDKIDSFQKVRSELWEILNELDIFNLD